MIAVGIFCVLLAVCVVTGTSVLYAMVAGLVIFCAYALVKGYKPMHILKMTASGVYTAKNVLIVFMLIGILTASWRDSGTVAFIISYAVRLIHPAVLVLMCFLLNSAVSFLIGTSFGTAATMGVVCMTTAVAMGIDPAVAGGAILSGVLFGDRCSPVSTSALLISELTHTNIFSNIKRMLSTAFVPFVLSCGVYILLSVASPTTPQNVDLNRLFSSEFVLSPLTLIPAVAILVLSFFRVKVKITLSVGILAAALVSLFVQKTPPAELLHNAFFGYTCISPHVGVMLDGGGVVSMLRVAAIVCISSAYSGIFKETGMLDGIKKAVLVISHKTTPFFATLVTSVATGVIACNQTLTIMLTHGICRDIADNEDTAIALEDTAVVIASLIPWSIACAVPITTVNAPTASVAFAVYLYIIPLWGTVVSFVKRRK